MIVFVVHFIHSPSLFSKITQSSHTRFAKPSISVDNFSSSSSSSTPQLFQLAFFFALLTSSLDSLARSSAPDATSYKLSLANRDDDVAKA